MAVDRTKLIFFTWDLNTEKDDTNNVCWVGLWQDKIIQYVKCLELNKY